MSAFAPPMTALAGTLARTAQGWQWSDGTPAPHVQDLCLRDLAPSWRCTTYGLGSCYVELPWDWPRQTHDPDVRAAVADLLAQYPASVPIYAEGIAEMVDDHRLTRHGHRFPIACWDAAMARVIGATWLFEHEPEILSRARDLGWSPPA